jgi:hypothetical protein
MVYDFFLANVSRNVFGGGRGGIMAFNATFNNISVMSWWSVLLMDEMEVPGENNRPAASHWQTLSHNVLLKSNYHSHDHDRPLNVLVLWLMTHHYYYKKRSFE